MSTILVVEDNEKNMKLVRDILRHKGHATLEAASGEEGVRLALAHRPDLILMDIQLRHRRASRRSADRAERARLTRHRIMVSARSCPTTVEDPSLD
jgi:CheY-like chemotaxis protein